MNCFPQNKKTTYMSRVIQDFKSIITENHKNMTLIDSINDLLGEDHISLMSIHKSKGLEFENVFLIGLEDSAFFNYTDNPDDENCTFFVAFSRAKKRVFFTMAENRINNRGWNINLSLSNIKPIIEIISKSDIKLLKYSDSKS